MGCNESGCSSPACSDTPKEPDTNKHGESEAEEFLKDLNESECGTWDPPPAGRAVLDFAQKMSEEIVAQALQLCWEADIQFSELPFIDSECDYVV